MTQVLSQISVMLSDVIHLYIKAGNLESEFQDDIAWLELLRPFTALETLRVSPVLTKSVALTLKGVTGAMDFPRLHLEV